MGATNKSKKLLEGMVGKKFGQLTIVEITGKSNQHKRRLVNCVCDCGKYKLTPLTYLKRGQLKSCGCLRDKASSANLKAAHKKLFDSGTWEKDPKIASAKKIWQNYYSDENLTFNKFLEISQQNCFYCGQRPSNCCNAYCSRNSKFRQNNGSFIYSGLDRVDNNFGHSFDNVVPCCINCNKAKSNRSKKEFLLWIKAVYDKHY